MAVSTIPMNITELKVLSVSAQKTNTNNVYLTASVPSGYKFLCWIGFGVSGAADWAATAYEYWHETVRVWTGSNTTATVLGNYIVYR